MDLIRPAASPPEAAGRLISGKLSADDPQQPLVRVAVSRQFEIQEVCMRLILTGFLFLIMSTPNSAAGSPSWQLLKYEDGGLPVIMKVMEDFPAESIRAQFGWLTVISWRYDATENNGMPLLDVNNQMIDLESAIDDIQENDLCVQVYSKTGNGLKELVYYIGDRDEFMKAFNDALADQPRYPLDIEFFEDPEWGDLKTVHTVYLRKE